MPGCSTGVQHLTANKRQNQPSILYRQITVYDSLKAFSSNSRGCSSSFQPSCRCFWMQCGNVGSEVTCFSMQLLQLEKKAEHSALLHKEKKCKTAEPSQPQATVEPGPSAQVVRTGDGNPDEL